MPGSRSFVLTVILLAFTGCGTLHNLQDRPNSPTFFGTGSCYPFGGVVRSFLLAGLGTQGGVAQVIEGDLAFCQGEFSSGLEQIGNGMLLTSAGLGAVVDCPLSLAGDILTFPIAYARSKEFAWATWWGEKTFIIDKTGFVDAQYPLGAIEVP
jgi:hypothetical protein